MADAEVELFSVAGHDGYLREVNALFADLLGLSPHEIIDRSLLELVHPDDIIAVVTALAALEGGAAEILLESRFRQADGRWVHLQWVARPVPGTNLWWASGRNTTKFHELLAERVQLRAQVDLALGDAKAAMWELDVRQDLISWEPQAASIFDLPWAAVPHGVASLAAAVHPEDAAVVLAAFAGLKEAGAMEISARTGQDAAVRHICLRGKVLDRDRRGKPLRAVGLLFDVTTEKAMEELMLHMVMSDALTGIPNRRAFDQALRKQWRICTRVPEPVSVLMIDIDHFKAFNNDFGHLIGDEALCAVARALGHSMRPEDGVLARFGGEEFAVVLPGGGIQDALRIADRMVRAVQEVVVRQAAGRSISVSVGTASWQPGITGLKASDLLARADQALYVAKSDGKNRAVAYEHALASRDALVAAIRNGLGAGEFELYYQPAIDLSSGEVVGFEALMRWNRPGHGLVSPDDFIPAAEASDLICDLGRWALREAACQLATWIREGHDPRSELWMAVNASARHVNDAAIVADVQAALSTAGIKPSRLELELTETALAKHDLAAKHLAAVRALGVSVAIDDFGTGYTSVGQLPHLPADALKIDRSFVASQNPRQRSLVTLMIAAAHAFDLRVVAEGIEDASTLEFLRDLGCDTAQGFLMGRPMPADIVPSWLAEWRRHHPRGAHPVPPRLIDEGCLGFWV